MSFGGGFAFGSTKPTTAAASPFSFGSNTTSTAGMAQPFGAATAQQSAGGFTLGAPTTQTAGFGLGNPATQATGFNLGTPATQATGFSLGAPTTQTAGFSLGTPATQMAGFSLGAPATQTGTTSGFSFSQSLTQPVGAATGLSFGSTPSQAATPSGLNFGGGIQSAAPSSGFSLTGAAKSTSGFSFSVPQAGATTTGFQLGSQTTTVDSSKPPVAGLGFQLNSNTSAPSVGFTLGAPQVPTATVAPPTQQQQQTAAAFNLGAPTAATTTSTAGGLQLGSAGSGFQLGGHAGGTTTSAPSVGFQLGGAAPPKKTTMTAPGGLSLGGTSGFQLGTQPVATAATTLGGLGLGLGIPATSGVGLSLPVTMQQPAGSVGGLSLGTLAATPATNPLLGGLLPSTTATSATNPLLGGLLSSSASAAAKPTLTFGGITGPSTATSSSATTTTTTSAPTATMTYRQLEQSINKWTVELEDQENIFLQQAAEVNNWDKVLIQNGEKITTLHNDMERVKADQKRLSHELDYVVAQQRELEDMLIPLEESVRNTEGVTYTQHTDLERERTYQMAETVDSQLKRMVQDLKEIIEHMNTVNTPRNSTDPLAQIAKILNAHMNSLQWIDQTTKALEGKVEDVSRIYELVKRDQERNVHLAFD